MDWCKIGMIAGAGDIPYLIAQHAYRAGRPVPTIALSAQVAALLSPYCPHLTQCGPGQLGKIIRVFQRQGVQQVVIVGKVEKQFFFETPWVDWRTLRGLRRLPDYRDMTILRALAAEFASAGLIVLEQTHLLHHLLTPAGVLGQQQPNQRAWEDIGYGFRQARHLAELDIGQTVVVRRRTVLAVEALEGTDAAIQRGCQYGQQGAAIVKVNRPQPDMRFDVPAVGPQTLQAAIHGGASVLAVEAGTTLMLHRQELIAQADAHRIALVGVSAMLLQQKDV